MGKRVSSSLESRESGRCSRTTSTGACLWPRPKFCGNSGEMADAVFEFFNSRHLERLEVFFPLDIGKSHACGCSGKVRTQCLRVARSCTQQGLIHHAVLSLPPLVRSNSLQ